MLDTFNRSLPVRDGTVRPGATDTNPSAMIYRGLYFAAEIESTSRAYGPCGLQLLNVLPSGAVDEGAPAQKSSAEDPKSIGQPASAGALPSPYLYPTAARQAFATLWADLQGKNAVKCAVEVGAFLSMFLASAALVSGYGQGWALLLFALGVCSALAVLGRNYAQARAVARSQERLATTRMPAQILPAYRVLSDEAPGLPGQAPIVTAGADQVEGSTGYRVEETVSTQLKPGDLVLVGPGQLVPADGDLAQGVALIDEAVITGESTPVLREAGSRYGSVMAGVRVVSGTLLVRIVSN